MKRVLVFSLILAMAFPLIGCNDSAKEDNEKVEKQVEEEVASDDATDPQYDEEFKVKTNGKVVASDELDQEEQDFLRWITKLLGVGKNDEVEVTVDADSKIKAKIYKNGNKDDVETINVNDAETSLEKGTYLIKMNDKSENGSITVEKIK